MNKINIFASKFSSMKQTLFLIVLATSILVNCKAEKRDANKIEEKSTITYASGFDIQYFEEYSKLIIKSPYPDAVNSIEYFLIPNSAEIPGHINSQNIVRTPLTNIVVTSTTHVPMLELIGEETSITGFPNLKYISSEKTSQLIERGKIRELGKEESINTEVVLELNPDAVIGFALNNNNRMFDNIEKAGIPVLLNGDWLEETPLGRAEWIKFFGILFEKTAMADSIFSAIESEYRAAREIAKKATDKPSLLSGIEFNQVWNVPAGESFVAQYLTDANVNYLWSDTKGKGSLSLSFEAVFETAQNAAIWIDPGQFTSYDQMMQANEHYAKFQAFQNRMIYTYSMKKGANGGILYYELAPVQPHIVLKDLIKVAHPELLPDYQPYFLEKLQD